MGKGRSTCVVAVEVLGESESIQGDLVHKPDTLVIVSIINAASKHAATIRVSGALFAQRRAIDELHEVSTSGRKDGDQCIVLGFSTCSSIFWMTLLFSTVPLKMTLILTGSREPRPGVGRISSSGNPNKLYAVQRVSFPSSITAEALT